MGKAWTRLVPHGNRSEGTFSLERLAAWKCSQRGTCRCVPFIALTNSDCLGKQCIMYVRHIILIWEGSRLYLIGWQCSLKGVGLLL